LSATIGTPDLICRNGLPGFSVVWYQHGKSRDETSLMGFRS
jgi:hypothetical protein